MKDYETQKCPVCGKDIPEKKIRKSMGGVKYCSVACRNIGYKKAIPNDATVMCVVCGKKLNAKQVTKGNKHCSVECRDKGRLPKCLTCGKQYQRKNHEKYCSEECKKRSPNMLQKMEKLRKAKFGKQRDEETKRKLRLSRIKQIGDANIFGGQKYPCFNKGACVFFNEINRILGVSGMHAMNGGEYRDKELGYWYDYYIPELKIIIEWDEEKHFTNNEYTKKDCVRNYTILKYKPDHLLIRVRQRNDVDVLSVVSKIVAFSGAKVVSL